MAVEDKTSAQRNRTLPSPPDIGSLSTIGNEASSTSFGRVIRDSGYWGSEEVSQSGSKGFEFTISTIPRLQRLLDYEQMISEVIRDSQERFRSLPIELKPKQWREQTERKRPFDEEDLVEVKRESKDPGKRRKPTIRRRYTTLADKDGLLTDRTTPVLHRGRRREDNISSSSTRTTDISSATSRVEEPLNADDTNSKTRTTTLHEKGILPFTEEDGEEYKTLRAGKSSNDTDRSFDESFWEYLAVEVDVLSA